MSLNTHTMDEIWNSAYMRHVRRAMLKGEHISACEVCYQSEAATGQSYRTTTGLQPVPGKAADSAEMRKYGARSGFTVDQRPTFIKLEIGNLCNLKCRMCYGAASSQIERDPIHGKWSGGVDPMHAVWRGNIARIGPEPRIGVRTSGVYPQEPVDGAIRCWTDGHAIFNVPRQAGSNLASLEITFHSAGINGQQFEVVVDGRPVAKGVLQNSATPVSVDLSSFGDNGNLIIEILSSKIVQVAGERERGVPLSSLVLHRKQSATSAATMRPELLSSIRAGEGRWYMDDAKLFDDVLKSADHLQRLYITGGEPLINDRVAEILDFLIDSGAATHIDLELSTNCTHVDARAIDRLKRFRRIELFLSLDGIEDTYEYIRYPARWRVVDANVRKLKNEYNLACLVPPVVQIYNVLRLTELFRYCDAMGLDIALNLLQTPERLAIQNLPPKTRKAAAAMLFKYLETECLTANKSSVLWLAQYLDELTTPADPKIIREMMVFTNDLDATRGQSFRKSHPELVRYLAEDGFDWVDDTLYAKEEHHHNRPARERAYAWL